MGRATDGGLAQLDNEGHWHPYTKANTNDAIPDNFITALAFDRNGELWIGTFKGGLVRFDKNGRWRSFKTTPRSVSIASLAFGPDGALWIGAYLEGGVTRLDPGGSLAKL